VAIWYILLQFGICILWPFGIYCGHLVSFRLFGTFFFGMLYQDKAGNAEAGQHSAHPGKKMKRNLFPKLAKRSL
jgi:hypothetical protein